jgi:hypothetical protein
MKIDSNLHTLFLYRCAAHLGASYIGPAHFLKTYCYEYLRPIYLPVELSDLYSLLRMKIRIEMLL